MCRDEDLQRKPDRRERPNQKLKLSSIPQNVINLNFCKVDRLFLLFLRSLQGTMAEWLGMGLQNLVQRFESAWYLK